MDDVVISASLVVLVVVFAQSKLWKETECFGGNKQSGFRSASSCRQRV